MKNKREHSSICWFMLLLGMALGVTAFANNVPLEYFYLDGLAEPKRWAPSECELSVSPHTVWDRKVLTMRVPVDYSTGEKNYPIGWPRMYLTMKQEEQVWHEYDRLEFQIMTEFSRPLLPKRPLVFHVYNQQNQKNLTVMDMVAIGKWSTVQIKICDLGLVGTITRLGFNVNEADYRDKDLVAFHIGGFRLVRPKSATVTEMNTPAPALFCDSRALPLELMVEGPAKDLAAGVPVQLSDQINVVLTRTDSVSRGRQTIYIPLEGVNLSPGQYSLTAFPDAPGQRKKIAVTLTTSPWR
jgi:hypothetical protein